MASFEWDEFGQRYFVDDDGVETLSPEGAGLMEFAGKQFADIGSNLSRPFRTDEAVDRELQERETLFRGAEFESPFTSAIGEALPGLSTLPITAGGALGTFGLNVGLGALEGALSYDPNASAGQRALSGGLAGGLGDVAGRAIGRVLQGAKGLAADMLAPRKAAANIDAQAFEEAGGATAAFQRMEPGTRAQGVAERAAQFDVASANPSRTMGDIATTNEGIYRGAVNEAVGGEGTPARLDRQWRSDTLDRMDDSYKAIADEVSLIGPMPISEELSGVLKKQSQISQLRGDFGDFEGLDSNQLSGFEWKTARESLAEDAAKAWKNGRRTVGARLDGLVNELDDSVEGHLPDKFLDQYARLREQNRVFRLIERPNVINRDGEVNLRSLGNVLDSKAQGFGRKATAGKGVTNDETQNLLDWVEMGEKPGFQAFRSSGTAENLATRDLVEGSVNDALSLARGDPLPAISRMGKLSAPGIVGASQVGSGQMFEGLVNPTPGIFPHLGGRGAGSLLDEALYPFVGVEDERQQQ